MRHDVLNSPRLQELKKNRRIALRNKIIFFFSLAVAILLGLGFLSRLSVLNIKEVSVVGNVVVDTEDIQKVVDDTTSGYYFWLFPKTNIFLYPKNKINENLSTEFRRLKDISFNLKNNGVLEINLAEREGVYIWCGVDFPQNSEKEECLFIDKDGYTFDEAPYFSGEVYFKFYGSMFETYSPMFSELIKLKENLEQIGLKPVALLAKEGEDMKILLSSARGDEKNPEITLRIDSDLEKLAENLQAALDTEPLKTDIKTKYSLLEYIDLRYGNKVYYKFK
jgi:cell division septal protein FtsQ